jgi:hypothetical protein
MKNRTAPSHASFRCDDVDRLLIGIAMARTGLTLSEFVRRCLEPNLRPLFEELRAASADCPPGADPERWFLQCGQKLMAAAQAERLRAQVTELEARAR